MENTSLCIKRSIAFIFTLIKRDVITYCDNVTFDPCESSHLMILKQNWTHIIYVYLWIKTFHSIIPEKGIATYRIKWMGVNK